MTNNQEASGVSEGELRLRILEDYDAICGMLMKCKANNMDPRRFDLCIESSHIAGRFTVSFEARPPADKNAEKEREILNAVLRGNRENLR